MEISPNDMEPRQGTRDIGRGRTDAVALVAISVPVALVIPFLCLWLVGRAQDACLDLEAGHNAFLSMIWVGLAIVSGWLFWVGALAAWRRPMVVRVGAGLALVLVLCLVATWQLVPWGSPGDYPATTVRHCGPGGIPTWWPPILPHR